MDQAAAIDPASYQALAADCRTVNQFNRLHLDIENIATPRELYALARWVGRANVPTRYWLNSMRRLDRSIFSRPEPYVREEIAPFVLRFSDPAVPAEGKQAMIGFCGRGPRLMIPIGYILQALPASRWDVIFLVKRSDPVSYFDGFGLASSLPGLMDRIRAIAGLDRYRRVVAMGASVGGHPAIHAGLHLGIDRVVALGTRPPAAGVLPDPAASPSPPRMVFVYGERHEKDAEGAKALFAHFGGELAPVRGVSQHAMLFELLKKRRLPKALAAFLGDDPPPRPWSLGRLLGLHR